MTMNYGMAGIIGRYGMRNVYPQTRTVSGSTGFLDAVSAKAAERVTEQVSVAGMSFKDMWQARFPGAYYHTADASSIPQGVWERNDFPFEKFFCNDLDESAVNWKPNGANPAMDSSGVQSRLHSIAGQKSIVVPPELEEKMKNDPALAKQVMARVESFIATNQVPGTKCRPSRRACADIWRLPRESNTLYLGI